MHKKKRRGSKPKYETRHNNSRGHYSCMATSLASLVARSAAFSPSTRRTESITISSLSSACHTSLRLRFRDGAPSQTASRVQPVEADQAATLEGMPEYDFVAGTGPAASAALPPARGVTQGASQEAHGRAESSFAVISRKNASE